MIPINLIIALILALPKGIGISLANNDLTIDKILTVLILPIIITRLNNKKTIYITFTILSFILLSLILGTQSWLGGINIMQIIYYFYDIIFITSFICIGLYITQSRSRLQDALKRISYIALIVSIVSFILYLLNIDLGFLQAQPEAYLSNKSRGNLDGIEIYAFSGFFSNQHRAAFSLLMYQALYTIYYKLSSKKSQSVPPDNSKLINPSFSFFISLIYNILILSTQIRSCTILSIILSLTLFVSYTRKLKIIRYFILSLISLSFLIIISGNSYKLIRAGKYNFSIMETIARSYDDTYESESKFNLVADKRIQGITTITSNGLGYVNHHFWNPLGPTFRNNINTPQITGIAIDYWFDLSPLIHYCFAYGYAFVLIFIPLIIIALLRKSELPKIPFIAILIASLFNDAPLHLYLMLMISAIYLSYPKNNYSGK